MEKVIIFGNKKLAELAHFYLTHDSPYKVAAFTVNNEFIENKQFMDLPVIPFEKVEKLYPPDKFRMFIAIGYKKLNKIRAEKYYEAKNKGYKLISYICSNATVWDGVEIGDNCFILESQIMQPFVKIGNNVVLWGGCHFGHNTVVEEHCWISPHAALCGGVTVGKHTFIGTNVTIRDNVSIGRESIIGAGALILNDVGNKEVYIGKPSELYPLDSERFEMMMDISR